MAISKLTNGNKKLIIPIAALAFAVVASLPFLIYRSLALTRQSAVVESDASLAGGAKKIIDASASGGYAVKFDSVATGATKCALSDKLVPACGLLVGGSSTAPLGYEWSDQIKWDTTSRLQAIQQLESSSNFNRKLEFIRVYENWGDNFDPAGNAWIKGILEGNRNMFVSVAAPATCKAALKRWACVASGEHDARINSMAAEIKKIAEKQKSIAGYAYPARIWFTFGHEMDAHVGEYGTAAEYVSAYKRMRDLFVAAGATNVVWFWNPVACCDSVPWKEMYPGDAYVDWITFDPYNWYGNPGRTDGWRSFADMVQPKYDWATKYKPGDKTKPIALTEYGSTAKVDPADPANRNRPAWLRAIPGDVKNKFPQLKALSYYNSWHVDANPPIQTTYDWRLERGDDAMSAYQEIVNTNFMSRRQ